MIISQSYEDRVRLQFDSFCRKILREEFIDYMRLQKYRIEHEVPICEKSFRYIENIEIWDEYPSDYFYFNVNGCNVRIENAYLAKALKELSEEKRQIILLSYFFGMSDQKIADSLSGVRRTIQYKRSRSLKELKRIMEELFDDEEL